MWSQSMHIFFKLHHPLKGKFIKFIFNARDPFHFHTDPDLVLDKSLK